MGEGTPRPRQQLEAGSEVGYPISSIGADSPSPDCPQGSCRVAEGIANLNAHFSKDAEGYTMCMQAHDRAPGRAKTADRTAECVHGAPSS